jgi:hypothetical protein
MFWYLLITRRSRSRAREQPDLEDKCGIGWGWKAGVAEVLNRGSQPVAASLCFPLPGLPPLLPHLVLGLFFRIPSSLSPQMFFCEYQISSEDSWNKLRCSDHVVWRKAVHNFHGGGLFFIFRRYVRRGTMKSLSFP